MPSLSSPYLPASGVAKKNQLPCPERKVKSVLSLVRECKEERNPVGNRTEKERDVLLVKFPASCFKCQTIFCWPPVGSCESIGGRNKAL
ncbi:hypothetical protein TNCT_488201 [Trichonephila clavata]|uniref:Uncharacterized protein n=1 Tax=Trichonephila clavata TaxID=2740835 RepID=A0A8X6IHC4_TRICU|nr:hypothetical protein TNCT_488201 [Trichonephila clavata]